MNTLVEACNDPVCVERGRYVRICVELYLRKRLVLRVLVANDAYNVVYEGFSVICFSCGRYSHRCYNFPSSLKPEPAVQGVASEVVPKSVTHQPRSSLVNLSLMIAEKFGEWMLVSHGWRVRLQRRLPATNSTDVYGRRFTELRKEKRAANQMRFDLLASIGDDDTKVAGVSDGYTGVVPNLGVLRKIQSNWQKKSKQVGVGSSLAKKGKGKKEDVDAHEREKLSGPPYLKA